MRDAAHNYVSWYNIFLRVCIWQLIELTPVTAVLLGLEFQERLPAGFPRCLLPRVGKLVDVGRGVRLVLVTFCAKQFGFSYPLGLPAQVRRYRSSVGCAGAAAP